MAENGTSRSKHARAPLYKPNNPSSLTTCHARTLAPPAISPATCKRIFTISNGFVNTTCDAPAYDAWKEQKMSFWAEHLAWDSLWLTHPPAIHSDKYGNFEPSFGASLSRTKSLTVNLMAFSGATPINWGTRPRYSPRMPSCRTTFLKQSIEFR